MLSRRGLLFTGSAAIALGMVGNRPLLTVAAEENRYLRVFTQMNALDASAQSFRGVEGFGKLPEYTAWLRRGDALLRDLRALFPEEPNREIVRQIFDHPETLPELDEKGLREFVPGCLPIAVVREMVQARQLPFHMQRQPEFTKFVEHYFKILPGI